MLQLQGVQRIVVSGKHWVMSDGCSPQEHREGGGNNAMLQMYPHHTWWEENRSNHHSVRIQPPFLLSDFGHIALRIEGVDCYRDSIQINLLQTNPLCILEQILTVVWNVTCHKFILNVWKSSPEDITYANEWVGHLPEIKRNSFFCIEMSNNRQII